MILWALGVWICFSSTPLSALWGSKTQSRVNFPIKVPSSHRFRRLHSEAQHPHIIIECTANFLFLATSLFWVTDKHTGETEISCFKKRFISDLVSTFSALNIPVYIISLKRKQIAQKAYVSCNSQSSLVSAEWLACQHITRCLWKVGQNVAKDFGKWKMCTYGY